MYDRPVKTLRQHLDAFLDSKEPEENKKTVATLNKIAKETSLAQQILYLKEMLGAVKGHVAGQQTAANRLLNTLEDLEVEFTGREQALRDARRIRPLVANSDAQRVYEIALADFNLTKSRLSSARAKIYQYLEDTTASELKDDYFRIAEIVTKNRGPAMSGRSSFLDTPVVVCPRKPANKRELSQSLSQNVGDYLFIKDKTEGAHKPGAFGGEYICCYATGAQEEGFDIDVQRVLIKQDTKGRDILHKKNIAEYLASEILGEVIGDDAATVFLARAPWDPQGRSYSEAGLSKPDPTGESVYNVSVFFDGFTDLYKDLYAIDKKPAEESFYETAKELLDLAHAFRAAHGSDDALLPRAAQGLIHSLTERILQDEKHRNSKHAAEIVNDFDMLHRKLSHIDEYTKSEFCKKMRTGLPSLTRDFKKIIEETPDQRPKFQNTPAQLKFTNVFNRNIFDKEDKSKCAYDGYAPIIAGSLLVGDFDTHTANLGCVTVPGKAKKRLKRIDFGEAFDDLPKDFDMHSHWEHLPFVGPTNHVREWSRKFRINEEFADELERQGNYDGEKLQARIKKAIKNLEKFHGLRPLASIVKHLGVNVSALSKEHRFKMLRDQNTPKGEEFRQVLLAEARVHLKNVLLARQASLLEHAMQIRVSVFAERESAERPLTLKTNPKLDELIKQHPNYFVRGKFHFRDDKQILFKIKGIAFNKKKPLYDAALKRYVKRVLRQNDALCPVMKKDHLADEGLRAKIFHARLRIMMQVETDKNRKQELAMQIERLGAAINNYYSRRGRIRNIWNDIAARHLVHFCDASYSAVKKSYEAIIAADPSRKAMIEKLMDGGSHLDLKNTKQAKEYIRSLQQNVNKAQSVMKQEAYEERARKRAAAKPASSRGKIIKAENYDVKAMLDTNKVLMEDTTAALKSTEAVMQSVAALLAILSEMQKSAGRPDTAAVALKALRRTGLFAQSDTQQTSEELPAMLHRHLTPPTA